MRPRLTRLNILMQIFFFNAFIWIGHEVMTGSEAEKRWGEDWEMTSGQTWTCVPSGNVARKWGALMHYHFWENNITCWLTWIACRARGWCRTGFVWSTSGVGRGLGLRCRRPGCAPTGPCDPALPHTASCCGGTQTSGELGDQKDQNEVWVHGIPVLIKHFKKTCRPAWVLRMVTDMTWHDCMLFGRRLHLDTG